MHTCIFSYVNRHVFSKLVTYMWLFLKSIIVENAFNTRTLFKLDLSDSRSSYPQLWCAKHYVFLYMLDLCLKSFVIV